MAIVTATITIDFIANYAGAHRVCWRIAGSGNPYNCSTSVACVGGATVCQAVFTAPVNTTSCDGTVTFEGYIQAECEDLLSTSGRLTWTANFVPTVVCERFDVLCARGGIQTVVGNPIGQEYLVGDTLAIVRNGADPETSDGALTIFAVGTGVINSISTLLSGGAGYNVGDTIDIVGSAGTLGVITVDAETGGVIDALPGGASVTVAGSGYIGPFTFVTATGGGAGADFDLIEGVDFDTFGAILSVTVVTPGSYSIPPTVTITTGTGSGATLDVNLVPCGAYTNIGDDCNATQVDLLDSDLDVGETFATCIEGGLDAATPAEYDVTRNGCCIPGDTTGNPCSDYHIENNSGGPVNVHVTLCEGDDETVTVANGTTEARCLVKGGFVDPDVAGLTITDQLTPCGATI